MREERPQDKARRNLRFALDHLQFAEHQAVTADNMPAVGKINRAIVALTECYALLDPQRPDPATFGLRPVPDGDAA